MALFERLTRTFCIITGASRGLGRSISKLFSKEWAKCSSEVDLILIAKSRDGLEETKIIVCKELENSSVKIHLIESDLGNLDKLEELYSQILNIFEKGVQYSRALLVHNAGTLDSSKRSIDFSGADAARYMDVNFNSFVGLTSFFMQKIAVNCEVKLIINMTSILATVSYPGYSLYGASRAARGQYLAMLAKENPSIRVLNYSPGPCETDMQRTLRKEHFDENARQSAIGSFERGEILDPDVSIGKLVALLIGNSFENGATVDYFDDKKLVGV